MYEINHLFRDQNSKPSEIPLQKIKKHSNTEQVRGNVEYDDVIVMRPLDSKPKLVYTNTKEVRGKVEYDDVIVTRPSDSKPKLGFTYTPCVAYRARNV